ncbi:MAG: class I SAM-dependent methyltransferase [Deltaproteobacteria bacterium]|nr:class I SAM-dependent methyltransferase [Deltaproteobacteria bacterium]MCL5793101.1 class I SAM-dependent methyltransferase [Deltaproteobacteria bacterium]
MHKFDPSHAHTLNNPQRLEHENPELILTAAGVRQDMFVVEIGSGAGFYTIPLSKIVGSNGVVYAVDVSERMLDVLKQNIITKQGHDIIKPLLSEETRIPIPAHIADMIINVNMLHEVEDKNAFMVELSRVMKKDGRLLIIDHKKEQTPSGPPVRDRISYEEVKSLLEQWFDIVVKGPSGEYQYGLIAMKAKDGK